MALVFSLSAYKSSIGASPLAAAQSHWEAIAAANPELLVNRYSNGAVLQRSYGVSNVDEVYRGKSIYSAWQEFFSQYKIKDFQIVQQQLSRDRSVAAQIQITAQSKRGPLVILLMSYQVHFDKTGKIIKEVWHTNPELTV